MSWVDSFERDGYAVIDSFLTIEECDELKAAIAGVISDLDVKKEQKTVFGTEDGSEKHLTEDYFLTSGDKIRYFFESGAINSEGELTVPKDQSLNKIGHALHWWNDVFKKVSFSDKMQNLAKQLSLADPAIIQSMYIFKNARVGGEVCPHQDASFLYMEPMKLYGVWIALDDATEENGCLWFIPGSHKTDELVGGRRMVRKTNSDGRISLTLEGTMPQPDQGSYKAAPVSRGSLVMIHGMVLHKSEPNKSSKPRNAYTLHFIEQKDTVWSHTNWLQPTAELPFTPLYQS